MKEKGIKNKETTEYRYSVNFTAMENAWFQTLFELSGVHSKSRFIKARVFDETFRVVKINRTLVDYTQKLSALFGQFRAIGVNYNQVTVALKSNFTEKKASALLCKLEKLTVELARVGGQIVTLTEEFRAKWSLKQPPETHCMEHWPTTPRRSRLEKGRYWGRTKSTTVPTGRLI